MVYVDCPVPPEVAPRAEARVRAPALENDDVAVEPKYAGPYEENKVVEAFPVSVKLAKFAVPVNVGEAERTTFPVPVEAVTPVPPDVTARAEARVSAPALEKEEVAVAPK